MKAPPAILALAVVVVGACVGVAAAASAPPAASTPDKAAAPLVKPGLWETTVVIEDTGSTTRRSIVGRVCVQAADASAVEKILPAPRERGLPCENRDLQRDGNGWSWTVTCRSPEATQTGSGRIALSGTSYLGRADLELRRKGAKAVQVKQTFSGRWIQACS